jgi:hypothetical protein
VENLKNPLQDFLSSLNGVISPNERFITWLSLQIPTENHLRPSTQYLFTFPMEVVVID